MHHVNVLPKVGGFESTLSALQRHFSVGGDELGKVGPHNLPQITCGRILFQTLWRGGELRHQKVAQTSLNERRIRRTWSVGEEGGGEEEGVEEDSRSKCSFYGRSLLFWKKGFVQLHWPISWPRIMKN